MNQNQPASMYKIVILSAQASNLIPCVNSVLEKEPSLTPDRIIVVDDGAGEHARSVLPGICWIEGIKPFVFARNANIGILAAASDVILLNDDARLVTSEGFTRLRDQIYSRPRPGIYSPGIRGLVGNPNQSDRNKGFSLETRTLAFVCVYIRKDAYDQLGPLDERFVGYGYEDNDYSARCLAAGLELGIWDGCVVEHSGHSTFRTRHDINRLMAENQRRFQEKWAGGTPAPPEVKATEEKRAMEKKSVDLMYLACNRLEFTRETFTTLLANTDWEFVNELFVYDDGSEDGTREWLEEQTGNAPVSARFIKSNFGSPVSAMADFIRAAGAPMLAKLDNDAMAPPGWLRQSLAVFDRRPELSLLGIEAMNPVDDAVVERTFTPAKFVSGLGLYRREVFAGSVPAATNKWYGLEEWQMARGRKLVYGWISPALPVFLLDRCPLDPWLGLSDEYTRRGWQRSWPRYDRNSTIWRWRWPETQEQSVAEQSSPPAFLCAMRIKNEQEHIREVIDRALGLCEQVLVFDDHSTDRTAEICRSFDGRVTVIESPFNGFDESRDKNYLLQKVIERNPEWVLWIDGDEVLEARGPEELKRAAEDASQQVAGFSLRVAYVWNDPHHVRVDGIFGTFSRTSMFRLRGQPLNRLKFRPTGFGGNLHCGNVPGGLKGAFRPLSVRLKHYGYMTDVQRRTKYSFYTTLDPNNRLEDNYRHLIEIPGARHAPGPPQIVPWSE